MEVSSLRVTCGWIYGFSLGLSLLTILGFLRRVLLTGTVLVTKIGPWSGLFDDITLGRVGIW